MYADLGKGTQMQEEKNNYTIGIMSGSIESDYVLEMIKGFQAGAIDNHVNLVLFLGPQIPDNCKEIVDNRITENCSFQFTTIYQYMDFIKPDAVIVTFGSLSSLSYNQTKDEFLDKLSEIPCLVLEEDFSDRDFPCLNADNYNGMKECIRHLIVDHGFHNISFLSGPKDNYDANERLSAYLDTMAEYNIPVTEGMVAYGNFSDYDEEQVEFLLDQSPNIEAIACADDMMAKACYTVCEKRNIIIGKDLAITGFDDSNMASVMVPPLTSVSQNVFEIGYIAMKKAVAMCKGEKIESEKMPTFLKKRRSCSCFPFAHTDFKSLNDEQIDDYLKEILISLSPTVYSSLKYDKHGPLIEELIFQYGKCIIDFILSDEDTNFDKKVIMNILKKILNVPFFFKNQLLESMLRFLIILENNASNDFEKSKLRDIFVSSNKKILNYNIKCLEKDNYEYTCKSWFVPLFIGNLIKGLYTFNIKDIFISIMIEMQKMSFKKSYFLLFDKPIIVNKNQKLSFPKNLNLISYFNENEMKYIGKNEDYQITYDNGFVSFIDGQDPSELSMVILFSDDKQYGLLICDVEDKDLGFVQICGLQIGSLLNFIELHQIQHKTQAELQTSLQVIKEQNRILNFLSEYDELTKLLNRRGFIEEALNLYNQNEGKNGYLIFGDLDHLKEINDVFGHNEGDYAIITIAERFKSILPSESVIGRIGGDEIVAFVLSEEINFERRISKQFVDVSNQFNLDSEKPYYIEASIGIHGFICDSKEDFKDLIAISDKRLYQAKLNRKKTIKK